MSTRYFNKKTAEKIASHEGVTMYRLKSGKYILSDNDTDDYREVSYLYFRTWVSQLPTSKLKNITTPPEGTLTVSIRFPRELKRQLWELAEYNKTKFRTYILNVLQDHVNQEPKVGFEKLKERKRDNENH